MPTYKNETSSFIAAPVAGKVIPFRVGEERAVDYVLPDNLGLTLVSAEPYFSPAVAVDAPASTGEDDPQTIALEPDCQEMEIYNSDSTALVKVYFESLDNPLPVMIPPGGTRKFPDVQSRASQIILHYSAAVAANVVWVHQFR